MSTMSAIISAPQGSNESPRAVSRMEVVQQQLMARMNSNKDKFLMEVNKIKNVINDLFGFMSEYENMLEDETKLAAIMWNPDEIIIKMKENFIKKIKEELKLDYTIQDTQDIRQDVRVQDRTWSTVIQGAQAQVRTRSSDSSSQEEMTPRREIREAREAREARSYITFNSDNSIGVISTHVLNNFRSEIISKLPIQIHQDNVIYTKLGFLTEEQYINDMREKSWDLAPQEVLKRVTQVVYDKMKHMTINVMDSLRTVGKATVLAGFTEKPFTNMIVYTSADKETYYPIYLDTFFKNKNFYLPLNNMKKMLIEMADEKKLVMDYFHSFEDSDMKKYSTTFEAEQYSHVCGWMFS